MQHSKHQRWFSKWPENLTLSIIDQSTDQVTVNHSVNTLCLSWLYGFCSFVLCFTEQITMKNGQSPFVFFFLIIKILDWQFTIIKIEIILLKNSSLQ